MAGATAEVVDLLTAPTGVATEAACRECLSLASSLVAAAARGNDEDAEVRALCAAVLTHALPLVIAAGNRMADAVGLVRDLRGTRFADLPMGAGPVRRALGDAVVSAARRIRGGPLRNVLIMGVWCMGTGGAAWLARPTPTRWLRTPALRTVQGGPDMHIGWHTRVSGWRVPPPPEGAFPGAPLCLCAPPRSPRFRFTRPATRALLCWLAVCPAGCRCRPENDGELPETDTFPAQVAPAAVHVLRTWGDDHSGDVLLCENALRLLDDCERHNGNHDLPRLHTVFPDLVPVVLGVLARCHGAARVVQHCASILYNGAWVEPASAPPPHHAAFLAGLPLVLEAGREHATNDFTAFEVLQTLIEVTDNSDSARVLLDVGGAAGVERLVAACLQSPWTRTDGA